MKYSDIEQLPTSHYQTHCRWNFLEETLLYWNDKSIDGWLGLNLDPDFQRGHVWTMDKRIEYIEYCLKGGESSRNILFNHPNWLTNYQGEMVLLDGKQRLESVRMFIRNEIPIFGGYRLNDFEDSHKLLRSNNAHLILNVFTLKTRRDILKFYLDLNSGGVVHTSEELNKVKEMLVKY